MCSSMDSSLSEAIEYNYKYKLQTWKSIRFKLRNKYN